jgi:hypothetical protein
MKLPNAAFAIVAEKKSTAYLLSPSHLQGGSKASFFSRFGFSPERWEVLADALRDHAQANEGVSIQETLYETRYTVEGPIVSPDGRNPTVRVGWYVLRGEETPRLATAVPRRRGRQQ